MPSADLRIWHRAFRRINALQADRYTTFVVYLNSDRVAVGYANNVARQCVLRIRCRDRYNERRYWAKSVASGGVRRSLRFVL